MSLNSVEATLSQRPDGRYVSRCGRVLVEERAGAWYAWTHNRGVKWVLLNPDPPASIAEAFQIAVLVLANYAAMLPTAPLRQGVEALPALPRKGIRNEE